MGSYLENEPYRTRHLTLESLPVTFTVLLQQN
jgi:hypothetical protein